jgi:DNA-binding transcriptional ArsR family regulator
MDTNDPRTVTEIDRIIHEPARLLVVMILHSVESADFLYLLRETGLSKGNLSSHLSKLESAGYVEIAKSFRGKVPLTLCRLTDTGRAAFLEYRDRLKRVVESTE